MQRRTHISAEDAILVWSCRTALSLKVIRASQWEKGNKIRLSSFKAPFYFHCHLAFCNHQPYPTIALGLSLSLDFANMEKFIFGNF